MDTSRYQLIVMGPGRKDHQSDLVEELKQRLNDLGLESDRDLAVFDPETKDQPDWRNVVASVWFGKPGTLSGEDKEMLARAIQESCPIFPVTDSVQSFDKKVPPELVPINGTGRDESDWLMKVLNGILGVGDWCENSARSSSRTSAPNPGRWPSRCSIACITAGTAYF
jgi:hypothetical protein